MLPMILKDWRLLENQRQILLLCLVKKKKIFYISLFKKKKNKKKKAKKLAMSGKSVQNATNSLLKAAKVSSQRFKEEAQILSLKPLPFSERVNDTESELALQLEIAKLEKELEKEKALQKLYLARAKEFEKSENVIQNLRKFVPKTEN